MMAWRRRYPVFARKLRRHRLNWHPRRELCRAYGAPDSLCELSHPFRGGLTYAAPAALVRSNRKRAGERPMGCALASIIVSLLRAASAGANAEWGRAQPALVLRAANLWREAVAARALPLE